MKLLKINRNVRYDFWGDWQCEFCNMEYSDKRGYNDDKYHNVVIPKLRCPNCGKNSNQNEEYASWYDDDMNVDPPAEPIVIPSREELEEQGLYDEEEDDSTIKVQIMENDGVDIIAITSASGTLPFYQDVKELSENNKPVTNYQAKNEGWDWLACFIPMLTFITDTGNEEKYMEINKNPGCMKCVIISLMAGKTLMGLYQLDDAFADLDPECGLLKKLNTLIWGYIEDTPLSFRDKAASVVGLRVDESGVMAAYEKAHE